MSKLHAFPSVPSRTGITLVEVMIALVLVATGLLGIAGSTSLMLRAVTAQASVTDATRRGTLRVAQLTAAGCAQARSGAADDARAGVSERWSVGAAVNGVAMIDDSIAWHRHGVPALLTVRSALLC